MGGLRYRVRQQGVGGTGQHSTRGGSPRAPVPRATRGPPGCGARSTRLLGGLPHKPVGGVPDDGWRGCPEDVYMASNPQKSGTTNGLAWASRRDVLEEHGLYDAFIVGGGDRAIQCAALGEFRRLALARELNAQRTEHYLAWARSYFNKVRGGVGSIPGHVLHLARGSRRSQTTRTTSPIGAV